LSDFHTENSRLRTTPLLKVTTESPTVKTFTFADKEGAKANPGQFLMLWIPGIDEIPLSVLETSEQGIVSVAVKKVGEATEALHEKRKGDLVGIRGPFGNSFRAKGNRLLMVGGGTGVAPLLFLVRKLIADETEIVFVLGAKTKSELLFINEMRRFPKDRFHLVTSTEDGTCGITGLCTEPVEKMLTNEKFDMIYSCGPERMVAKVFELAEKQHIRCEASLERMMRCAIGLCGSCVIGSYRVCADGPVFTSKQLREVRSEFGLTKRDRYGKNIRLD
jgi:dihydroorotate dehydrogenase electron transfer subunit